MSDATYILTTFSPAMFGEGASAHFRIVSTEEAQSRVGPSTKIVATRTGHERLARGQFPKAGTEVARYALLLPGTSAIHLHYRGPQVPDSGEVPTGGMVTFYLIEAENYQEPEVEAA